MNKVYLDHSATAPMEPEVLEAMLPYFQNKFGNSSSVHSFGREAKVALEEAREAVGQFIRSKAIEVYFTSCGTEADNLALKGIAFSLKDKGNHIVTSTIEHHAILHTCEYLEKHGFEITYLDPDQYGTINPDAVANAITDKTILVSIMHANNEVGTINDINKISNITKEKNVLFHTDAVQSFGKLPINVTETPIDLMSFSAHKIYGPKGTGGLYIRKGIQIEPMILGGQHERNRRAGTENIAGIIGLVKAIELCDKKMDDDYKNISQLRDLLHKKIIENISKIHFNGHPQNRLAGHLNLSFEAVEGESILLSLDLKGIAASSGSACTSGSIDPSHVLLAMKTKPELAQSAIRFTLGRHNTIEEINYVVEILPKIIHRLRSMSPLN